MRGRRNWAWVVALTAGTTAVGGAAQPALADDPPPAWGVTDHSGSGVGGTVASSAPAAVATTHREPTVARAATTRAAAPRVTTRAATTARAAVTRTTAAAPRSTTARPPSTPPTSAAAPTTAAPTTAAPTTDPAPTSRTSAPGPTQPAQDPSASGAGWFVQQQQPATGTPTPSSAPVAPGVNLPAAAHADGDVDLDLTGAVTGGDTTWNRAATGGSDWGGTLAAIAAARAGRTGTTYLRLSAPLGGTGAQAVPPAAFREAWRRWSETARVAFPQAKLVLAVDAGRDSPDALAPFWPGDTAVDVVGVRARIADPGQAGVVESLTDPRGLAAWLGFAAAHGKPVGVPDWGLESGADTPDGVTFTRWMQAALGTNAATPDQTVGRVAYAPLAAAPPTAGASAAPLPPGTAPATTPATGPAPTPATAPTALSPNASIDSPSVSTSPRRRNALASGLAATALPPKVTSSGS